MTRARLLSLVALGLVAAAVAATGAWVLAAQLAWPFELSQMEGVLADHARRAAAGLPIYAPPTADFVPLIYTPLSHWAAAPLVRAGLGGLAAARVVSLIGVAGAVLVGMALVRRATSSRAFALAVPLVAVAHTFDVQCFYVQARPDNLMSFFWMLAVASTTARSERRAAVLFGISGALCLLTKQSAAVMLGAFLLGLLLSRPRLALLCGLALAIATLVSFLAIDRFSGGWLSAYTLAAPAHHGVDLFQLSLALKRDFLGSFAFPTAAALLAAFALVARGRRADAWDDERSRARAALLVATLASLAFAAISIAQPNAVKNVYVAFALTGAAFLPAALDWAVDALGALGALGAPGALGRDRREVLEPFAIAVLAIALAVGLHDPRPFLPREPDRASWLALRETARRRGGEERAWVTLHGSAFGDGPDAPMRATSGALWDWVGGRFGGHTGNPVPADLAERIESGWFELILVPEWDAQTKRLIEARYEPDPSLGEVRLPAFTSGYPPKPELWWVRKR